MVEQHVVLIHGFWSSPRTWDRLAAAWDADTELTGVRWHRFGYESPKIPRPLSPARVPDYDDIGQSLGPFLAARAPHGDVAIVTHSQGGLILQRYLQWSLNEGRGHELSRIRSVVMLVCPHEGSDYLRSIRAVLGFGRHAQAGSLTTLNRDVSAARRAVLNQVVHATKTSERECPIPMHVYAGASDKVVRRVAAQSAFPNAAVLPGSHFSILDPSKPGNITAPTVKRHLLEDFGASPKADEVSIVPESRSRTDGSLSAPGDLRGGDTPSPGSVTINGGRGIQIGNHNEQRNYG